MIAYKLMRIKEGRLYPLFITRNEEILQNTWLEAKFNPTKGFKARYGWHCTFTPYAPHLKEVLASGEKRVWVCIEVEQYVTYKRPESQGGAWILSDKMKVLHIMSKEDLEKWNK